MSHYARIPNADQGGPDDSPLSLAISIDPPSPVVAAAPLPSSNNLQQVSIHIPRISRPPPKPTQSHNNPRHLPHLEDDDDHHLLSDTESHHGGDDDDDIFSPEPQPPKFIKLIGQPKPSIHSSCPSGDPEVLDIDPISGAPVKPTPASVVNASHNIHIPAPDPATILIDVLEATNEDPFTLEPFESLIDMSVEKEKDFILARVTTVDPNDENRLYYSYYAAHHINKVLFRTQPEEGLLHRMKAKNPLNNMTIVGDVHYFVVSAAAPSGSPQTTRGSFESARSFTSIRSFSSIRSATSIRSMLSVFSTASVGSTGSGRREFDRFRRKQPRAKSSSVNPHDTENSRAGLSRLLRMGQHGCRKRTLHLIMRPDAVENVVEDVVPLTEEEGGKGTGINGKGVYVRRSKLRPASAQPATPTTTSPLANSNGAPGQKPSRSRRNSMDDAYVEDEDKLTPKGSVDREAVGTTANFRAGSTTPRIHRRVRSISFSNEHRNNNGTTGTNLQDWIKTHSSGDSIPSPHDGDTTKPTHTTTQHRGQHNPPSHNQHLHVHGYTHTSSSSHTRRNRTPLLEQALLSPSSPPPTPDPIYYTARFYATDDDFLMKAAVRAYFKEHALETSDAVLFTIPSSRDDAASEVLLEGTEAHPALTGFVYAVSEDNGGWLGAGGRNARGLKFLLLAYILLGFILIKFIVPDAYAYIMAFVLIFLMCLIMILCL
ncbi:hypothetical protein DFJ77DRAFT_538706 [Powellomyces hirtus]|nr:hypothetical protein DFJ77DRAFT_538706 [Powellomyces hirtus]